MPQVAALMPNRPIRIAAIAGTVIVALTGCAGTAGGEPIERPVRAQLPVPFGADAVPSSLLPEAAPPGANEPSCRPSAEHPNPVILVNPAMMSQGPAWQSGAPFLANNGYCVYTFDFEQFSGIPEAPPMSADMVESFARRLSAEVTRVRNTTGAEKVDLVGNEEGARIVPNYYINRLGGADTVDKMIGISPSDYQAAVGDAPTADYDVAAAGPQYTTIVSRYDELAVPITRQYLDGPNVNNIVLQDDCEVDRSERGQTVHNRRVWHLVLNALDPAHATPAPCSPVEPASAS